MTVNIRFCGGCNPRYDRGALARRLIAAYPGVRFVYNADQETDALIILCGCTAACVKVQNQDGLLRSFTACSADAWDSLTIFLDSLTG